MVETIDGEKKTAIEYINDIKRALKRDTSDDQKLKEIINIVEEIASIN